VLAHTGRFLGRSLVGFDSSLTEGRDAELLARLTKVPLRQVVMSSVTLADLECGLHRKGQRVRLRNGLPQVLLRMDVRPWDEPAATCYREFCITLEAQGINLSDFDRMTAAHAVVVNATTG
jgi:tRNA(fMet)-specific endonuclease VapC